MKRRAAAVLAAALALMLGSSVAPAHHNIGMIETGNPVWIRGTVVRYEPRDPHVLIHVETKGADGGRRVLRIEGPILARLGRMHLARNFLKTGDAIELCGFPFRKDIVAAQRTKPSGTEPLPALHAQLLVLPDGRWQPWGPYGKLDNCIRDGDTPEAWARFIEGDAMAFEYWCKGLAATGVPSIRPAGFAEAVNAGLSRRCQ